MGDMGHFRALRPLLTSESSLFGFKTPNLHFQDPGRKERLGYAVLLGLRTIVVVVVQK